MVLDRKAERVRVIASAQGGMEIEEIAEDRPRRPFCRCIVEPAVGLQPFQAREMAFGTGPQHQAGQPRGHRDSGLPTARSAIWTPRMVEINPLVVTADDRIIALDAKMSFDDNALFRHPNVAEMRDLSQEDPREAEASQDNLNYVGLEGDIGCIINGAGLAMATMDTIKYAGGEPANFLDVGGGASPERVAKAFKLVLSDGNVKAILVNIFAGINRCDWVAQGVVQAVRDNGHQACRWSCGWPAPMSRRAQDHRRQRIADHQCRYPGRRGAQSRRRRAACRGRTAAGRCAMSILIDETTRSSCGLHRQTRRASMPGK